ncbi:MAG: V-type ATP synthase subunit E family protein [Candidatus Methanomethylophilaceae archaeon]|jgi:vacuolar-type H+-ATPase subunit E/Vma4
MALDDVKMEISRSADESAAAIRAVADAEVVKIMTNAETEISTMKEKEEKRLKEAIERLDRQEISSAELESKKIVLVKKKEILAQAFAETLASLESAPVAKKLEQYKKMVAASKRSSTNLRRISQQESRLLHRISEYLRSSLMKTSLVDLFSKARTEPFRSICSTRQSFRRSGTAS